MPENVAKPANAVAPVQDAPRWKKTICGVAVCGALTAMGKTTLANMVGSFFEAARVRVDYVRIETGRRRAQFHPRDGFVDLDACEDAANQVGGKATLFEDAWRRLGLAMRQGQAVVFDCGAGGQDLFLDVAGTTGLAGLMDRRGSMLWNIVMTAPDGESARQAARLVGEIRDRMPESRILLANNHLGPGQRPGLDTPQARSADEVLAPLALPRIEIPFCGAQALELLSASGRSILEVMAAEPEQLVKWTKLAELSSLSAQAHLAAWWGAVADQLSRLWGFDATRRR